MMITIPEAAHMLQVSSTCIRLWISFGWVPYCRIGPKFIRLQLRDMVALQREVKRLKNDNGNLNLQRPGVIAQSFNFPSRKTLST